MVRDWLSILARVSSPVSVEGETRNADTFLIYISRQWRDDDNDPCPMVWCIVVIHRGYDLRAEHRKVFFFNRERKEAVFILLHLSPGRPDQILHREF
jgi:hypothetical protein